MVVNPEVQVTIGDGFIFGMGFLLAQLIGGFFIAVSFALLGLWFNRDVD